MMTAFIINSGSIRNHSRPLDWKSRHMLRCDWSVIVGVGLGHGQENHSDPEPPVSTEAAALTIEALR